jgi:hypothetical protein
MYSGMGTVTVKGCVITLQHNPFDRRVLAQVDKAVSSGKASLQSPPGTIRCTITDRNTRNNSCSCHGYIRLLRLYYLYPFNLVASSDPAHYIHPVSHAAKDGVAPIQMRLG